MNRHDRLKHSHAKSRARHRYAKRWKANKKGETGNRRPESKDRY